jgi:CRP/FNR family cyclic AMP-dependent transcriptional regulator
MQPSNPPDADQREERTAGITIDHDGRARRRLPTRVALTYVEPDLLKVVSEADRPAVRRVPGVTRHELPPGPLDANQLSAGSGLPFGLLVLSGVLCRDTVLGDHASAHLFGPGAIIRPRESAATTLPFTTSWSCVVESIVAVLDEDFPSFLAGWPALAEIIQHQLSIQLEASLCQCAWTGLSRVDDRILALFWHLADAWGTVRRDGVAIDLPLTHRLIGRLVAAERATISLALTRLAAGGLLTKSGTRMWLLNPASKALLAESR